VNDSISDIENTEKTCRHDGFRILARIIARKYLEDYYKKFGETVNIIQVNPEVQYGNVCNK